MHTVLVSVTAGQFCSSYTRVQIAFIVGLFVDSRSKRLADALMRCVTDPEEYVHAVVALSFLSRYSHDLTEIVVASVPWV